MRSLWIVCIGVFGLVAVGCAEGSTTADLTGSAGPGGGTSVGSGPSTGSGMGGATTGPSTGSTGSTSSSGGPGSEGTACSTSADCASGLACAPAFDGGHAQCQPTCSSTAECTSPGGACIDLATGKKGTVCTPNCDPTTSQGCLPGDSCRIFSVSETGTRLGTYCGGTGTGAAGAPCTVNSDCVADAECVTDISGAGSCETLCDPSQSTCPAHTHCGAFGALGSEQVGGCG